MTKRRDDRAWDGTMLTPWPRGWHALNPLAWIFTALERDDLQNTPPGFDDRERDYWRNAGGFERVHERRRLDSPTLRQRHEDEIKVARLFGYSEQELRVLQLAQRMDCERIAYHIDAMRNESLTGDRDGG